MKKFLCLVAALAFAASSFADGFTFGTRKLRLEVNDYSGWGICSLKFNRHDYIDGYDHGRCLQSAVSFDGLGEAFNPTEVGGYADGLLPNPSTTRLLGKVEGDRAMASEVEMAFWQGGKRSAHVLRKYVTVGVLDRNIIEHRIAFEIPAAETHTSGQFEILTGYMPAEFSWFKTFDPATGIETQLSDGPGEQALPIIFCTPDERNCMGVYSPKALTGGGYGRWRFIGDKCMTKAGATGCVKWNMVSRVTRPKGTYRFHVLTTVGTLAEVKENMVLIRETTQ